MHVLRAADHKRMVWKNGGGETMEILVSPPGASMNNFDWRISMARVERDGPFSAFPGVDRTLAILSGAGIALTVEDQSVALTQVSAPYAFKADARSSATLIDGPVLDLNVMTLRERHRHSVQRVRGPVVHEITLDSTTIIVGAGAEALKITNRSEQVSLGWLDAAVVDGQAVDIALDGDVFVVTIWGPIAASLRTP